jgi:hypothetical protein
LLVSGNQQDRRFAEQVTHDRALATPRLTTSRSTDPGGAMQSLVATRSELLDRRRRAVFVSQGRDLLKDKRTALVREFGRHQSELLKGMERLRSRSVDARRCLDEGVAVCGPEPLASGALSAATGITQG